MQRVLFPDLTTVGAYRWADDHMLAVHVSDNANLNSVMLGDSSTGKLQVVAEHTGASLANIPGTQAMSYVDRKDEQQATLMSVDLTTHVTVKLLALPGGVEHVAWLPDRSVLVGSGARILRASVASPEWRQVIDVAGAIEGTITRLVISDDRRWIAIVTHVAS